MEERCQTNESIQDASTAKSNAIKYCSVRIIADEIAKAVRDNYAVIMTFGASDNGTMRSRCPVPSAKETWAHFILIGKANLYNGVKGFEVLNSWGEDVGEKGWQIFKEEWLPHMSGVYAVYNPRNPSICPVEQQKITLIEQTLNLLWQLLSKLGYKTK
jgi:hypothetical protein